MILEHRLINPSHVMRIGMIFLILAVVVPRLVQSTLGVDLTDGVKGFLFGVSIATNLLAVVLYRRRREGR
jgi:hypothetical protein